MTDRDYMLLAIEEAKKGAGWTSPNPMVGCVVVKDGRIISKDYHHRCGEFHAERNALMHCTEDPEGADLYATLEPCCMTGRTPPCTEIIIEKKIKRVIIGSFDPNPKVSGKGAQILREHGIEVVEGFMKDECDDLNDIFFHYITKRTPFVALKYAMTLDGKIASYNGASKWITGEEARAHVQQLRHRYTAICAGIGTVLADDPLLTCRLPGGRTPVRVICDGDLRIPPDSQICRTAGEIKTIIVCNPPSEKDSQKADLLTQRGITLLPIGRDLDLLMKELGSMDIDSILVEGGGILHEAFLKAGLANKVYCYVAPKLLGGEDAKTPVEGQGFADPMSCPQLTVKDIKKLGKDILIECLPES